MRPCPCLSIPGLVIAVTLAAFTSSSAGALDYQLKEGDTLAKAAAAIYGSRHYQLAVARYNKIADPKAVAPGTTLHVPDLKTMVVTEGLSKQVESDLDMLIAARYEFMKVENELLKSLARAAPGKDAVIPDKVVRVIKGVADDFDTAGRGMAKKAAYSESATRIKQRLEQCAKNLRELAAGKTDPKLAESIHLLLAQTWVRLIMWARLEDG